MRSPNKGHSIGLPIAIWPLCFSVIPRNIKDKLMIVPVKWTDYIARHSQANRGLSSRA